MAKIEGLFRTGFGQGMPQSEERKAYNKAYYQANKERIKAQVTARYAEKKEEIKAYVREYQAKHKDEIAEKKRAAYRSDPEKVKARVAARYAEKKEEIKAYVREYRAKHKDQIAEKNRAAYRSDPEKVKARTREWELANPERAKRHKIITMWRSRGIVCDDFSALYDEYLAATHCADCGLEFAGKYGDGQGKYRCLDHCHATGAARGVVCCGCNRRRGP
jgi:hypothetical protein